MYFVYILGCLETNRSSVGQTEDLIRRDHRLRDGSTRTTREKLIQPIVVQWENYPTRAAAMRRERYCKAGAGCRQKQTLIGEAIKVVAENV